MSDVSIVIVGGAVVAVPLPEGNAVGRDLLEIIERHRRAALAFNAPGVTEDQEEELGDELDGAVDALLARLPRTLAEVQLKAEYMAIAPTSLFENMAMHPILAALAPAKLSPA